MLVWRKRKCEKIKWRCEMLKREGGGNHYRVYVASAEL